MKITQELLEKYWNGDCTEEELSAIKKWLDSTEEESLDTTNELRSDKAQASVWSRLSKDIRKEDDSRKIIRWPYPLKFNHYAAACLLLLLLGLGYFLKYSPDAMLNAGFNDATKLVLRIPEQKKMALVDQNCKVQFSGVLSLYNPTSSEKKITCNDKIYTLAAGEKYIIDSRYPNLQTSSMRVIREFIVHDYVRTEYYANSTFQIDPC